MRACACETAESPGKGWSERADGGEGESEEGEVRVKKR